MFVHAMSTPEELLEVIVADDESDRQSNSAPKGVTPSDPVPELEHVALRDTEGSDSLCIGAEGDEVFSDVGHALGGLEEPVSGTLSVGDRFLSSESLACDDEERRLGVANLQSFSEVGSVDVGNEVGSEVPLGVGLESLGDHDRPQVGTTNTDVDNGVDCPSRVPLPSSISNGLGKLLHVLQHGRNLTGARLVDLELIEVTEGDVENGTILGSIDVLSGEHFVPVGPNVGLPNKIEEGVENGLGDQVFGVIQEEGDCRIVWRDVFLAELLEPVRILGEEVP